MYPYKVFHLESPEIKSKGIFDSGGGNIDGLTLATELEALLKEQHDKGLDLVNITPINGYKVVQASFGVTITKGLIVTFKKRVEV